MYDILLLLFGSTHSCKLILQQHALDVYHSCVTAWLDTRKGDPAKYPPPTRYHNAIITQQNIGWRHHNLMGARFRENNGFHLVPHSRLATTHTALTLYGAPPMQRYVSLQCYMNHQSSYVKIEFLG